MARDLNAQSAAPELVATLARHLRPFIPFDALFITLLEGEAPNEQTLRVVAFSNAHHSFPVMRRIETPENPLWVMLDHGWMCSETDVELHAPQSHLDKGMATRELSPVRAYINVPLIVGEKTIGILHLDSHSPRQWSDDELRFARLAGEQIASIVQGAHILSQSRAGEAQLARSLAILEAIQEAAADGICLVDDEGQLVSYNNRFLALWGISGGEEVELRKNAQVMARVLSQLADPDEFIAKIWEFLDNPDASARDEIRLLDGRIFERYSAPARGKDGHSFGRVWTFSDITQRKATEFQLSHQAFHDVVTGLPNRSLFTDRLLKALDRMTRRGRGLAVLFLDLDRFKVINDSLGHAQGDELLVQVAARLRSSLRPGDTAARFGGDEFVVLLEEIASPEEATRVADRIATNLRVPFSLGESEVTVTASVGIVLTQDPEDSPEDLLRKADVAMYRAKNSGKARYQIYSERAGGAAMDRLQLELDLHSALKRGEMEVWYQPLVELPTRRILGFEALLRWRHPARGLVSPADFIPLAEETGQIGALGSFVMRVACEQAKAWGEECGQAFSMHVNLSARQFEQPTLAAEVARILGESQLEPAQLVLEITESTVMTDAKKAVTSLEELKKLGVGLAIDDFGTGYSSLTYLEFFPIDSLKIDRSFVWRLGEGDAIVRAVLSLGVALGLEVVAEGVETHEQLRMLCELGCRQGQGFLFHKPTPASEIQSLLAQIVLKPGDLTL